MAGLPPVSDRTLRAVYDRALADVPDAIAQIGPGGPYTFAGSHDRSLRLAGGLSRLGIGRQEPAALLLGNSLDAVHTWSALGLGGMIEVPVNSAYKGDFLTHVLNDSGSAALVCEDVHVERVAEVAGNLTALETLVVRGDVAAADDLRSRLRVVAFDEVAEGDPLAPQSVDPADLMAYMYTSGTTGRSKGVLISLQQAEPCPDDADNPLELAIMAPLASDVDRFRTRFDIDLAAVYGMSEIGAVLNGPPDTLVGGECGFPREGYELRLVDGTGHDAAPGEPGELWVRPEDPRIVMRGYHHLPDTTAETIVDGWVHTGDAFRTDTEGRFYFADRMKDTLRRRGENVSSFEVERVVNSHPDIAESAVVAVPAELTEDEIKAVVVCRTGHDPDPVGLTRFLVDRLPYFMVPRYLEFVAELPKTPTQKVHKHLLRGAGVSDTTWDREAAGIVLRRADR